MARGGVLTAARYADGRVYVNKPQTAARLLGRRAAVCSYPGCPFVIVRGLSGRGDCAETFRGTSGADKIRSDPRSLHLLLFVRCSFVRIDPSCEDIDCTRRPHQQRRLRLEWD
ncbi:hypothetical protein EYF80_060780 [Liparis tanakae]|uniref:Uncharacterized protein n=1 Tax=Liparis tanakae TaxID=230148 RepID=A0A4Z2EL28_9TELE|nr:hypothetical protein EYF80_060780 [Liparis tanakae]